MAATVSSASPAPGKQFRNWLIEEHGFDEWPRIGAGPNFPGSEQPAVAIAFGGTVMPYASGFQATFAECAAAALSAGTGACSW